MDFPEWQMGSCSDRRSETGSVKHAKKEVEKSVIKPEEKIPEQAGWEQIGTGGVQTRVIKIPAEKLSGGDPRYNIVIKPGDSIQVPVDIIGEFCIMGNVNNQGFIDLTGRPMNFENGHSCRWWSGTVGVAKTLRSSKKNQQGQRRNCDG